MGIIEIALLIGSIALALGATGSELRELKAEHDADKAKGQRQGAHKAERRQIGQISLLVEQLEEDMMASHDPEERLLIGARLDDALLQLQQAEGQHLDAVMLPWDRRR